MRPTPPVMRCVYWEYHHIVNDLQRAAPETDRRRYRQTTTAAAAAETRVCYPASFRGEARGNNHYFSTYLEIHAHIHIRL